MEKQSDTQLFENSCDALQATLTLRNVPDDQIIHFYSRFRSQQHSILTNPISPEHPKYLIFVSLMKIFYDPSIIMLQAKLYESNPDRNELIRDIMNLCYSKIIRYFPVSNEDPWKTLITTVNASESFCKVQLYSNLILKFSK